MFNHIYIHWPFCKHKCAYCDFISFPGHEDFVERYHQALCNEIYASTKQEISTLFIGGGTPSRYPLPLLENLFEVLHQNFKFNLQEATIETNPEDITPEKLAFWKNLGLNRLSIGVQILDENILKSVNRFQSNKSVFHALSQAPNYFDNISVDLILGLPGTTTKIWNDTLTTLLKYPISHISVYFLTIYEKTPIYFTIAQNKVILPDEEWLINTYEETILLLEKNNFLQYEISNFARPGRHSTHNKAYWDRKPYRGFGLNAASFDGKKRLVNSNNLLEYMNSWVTNQLGTKQSGLFEEVLTQPEVFLEELMLGLRQKNGIDLQRMVYFLREEQLVQFEEKIAQLKMRGLLQERSGRIFLTTREWSLKMK